MVFWENGLSGMSPKSTNTASGSGANSGAATMGSGSVPAHLTASTTPARHKIAFRRKIVPAPSPTSPSASKQRAPRTTLRLRSREQRTPGAPRPILRPLEHRATLEPTPTVQPGLSWATVAARNTGPSGTTINASEKPATAPPRPAAPAKVAKRQDAAAPAKVAKRQDAAAVSATNTFSNPLEEGFLEVPGFHPMDALYENQADGAASSVRSWALDRLARELNGFSPNYQGNIHNPRNRPPLVDEKDNCSLFISNLPLGMKEGWLLDELTAIGPFGKVYQTHVMKPSDQHPLPSARLCLWDRLTAEEVYRAIDAGLLVISGMTAGVRWDLVQKAPHLGHTLLSRVILIRGPAHVADVESIYEILNQLVVYQTQKVSFLWETEEEREIRWIFGSFYAQAEPIRLALSRRWAKNPNISVRCGVDPLEVGLRGMEPSIYDVNPGPDNERKKLPRFDPDTEDYEQI